MGLKDVGERNRLAVDGALRGVVEATELGARECVVGGEVRVGAEGLGGELEPAGDERVVENEKDEVGRVVVERQKVGEIGSCKLAGSAALGLSPRPGRGERAESEELDMEVWSGCF